MNFSDIQGVDKTGLKNVTTWILVPAQETPFIVIHWTMDKKPLKIDIHGQCMKDFLNDLDKKLKSRLKNNPPPIGQANA